MNTQELFHEPIAPRVYSVDKTVGTVLMVLSAVAVPLLAFVWFVSLAVHGSAAVLHLFHLLNGHAYRSGGGIFELFHLWSGLGVLAAFVYAGYGISRSRKESFLVALFVGIFALFIHADPTIALFAVVYAGLRLFAKVGPPIR
jgi:hypothetical protein